MTDKVIDYYEFPTCLHAMAVAFHRENINPVACVVMLAHEDWCKLYRALERKMKLVTATKVPDGRIKDVVEFQYLGFTFRPVK